MIDRAERLINLLVDRDAWLCSLPLDNQGFYEPHRRAIAIDLMREALAEDARADFFRSEEDD